MIQPNKFNDLNERFESLETGITHMNYPFASLDTDITRPNKFQRPVHFTLSQFGGAPPTFSIFHYIFAIPQKKRRNEATSSHHRAERTRRDREGAEAAPSNQSLSSSAAISRIMAMAASSRLLWASRAAAYLRISTFPRAFSTGTFSLPLILCFRRSGSSDHGSLRLVRHRLVVSHAYRSDLWNCSWLGHSSAPYQAADTFREWGFTTGFSRRRSLFILFEYGCFILPEWFHSFMVTARV